MKEKLLLMAASLLGFATACGNKETPVMYGVPPPHIGYKVKGKVTDKAGKAIPGIEVNDKANKITSSSGGDGSYELSGEEWSRNVTLTFTDIDGPENGGEFATKIIDIEFTGSDYTDDSFTRTGVDAALDKKE